MSDVTVTLSADQAALLSALLQGSDTPAAPVADDTALRQQYATYVARVTRGKPRSFAAWVATQGSPAAAAAAAVADPSAMVIARLAARADCVAVLKVGTALVGCYRFMRKSDGADRFTMSGDGAAASAIMEAVAAMVVATGPAAA